MPEPSERPSPATVWIDLLIVALTLLAVGLLWSLPEQATAVGLVYQGF